MEISIDEYNKKYKNAFPADYSKYYNNEYGDYGAQKIDIFKSLGVVIITLIVHGDFRRVQKTFEELGMRSATQTRF
jgi:hypothetical protein